MFILKLNLKIIRLVKNTNINFHYVCNPNLTYILTARIISGVAKLIILYIIHSIKKTLNFLMSYHTSSIHKSISKRMRIISSDSIGRPIVSF